MNKKLQETLIKKINESVKRTLIDNLVLDQLDPKYFDKDGLLNLDKINMFPPELINLIAEDLLENGTIGDYDIFDDDMNVEI